MMADRGVHPMKLAAPADAIRLPPFGGEDLGRESAPARLRHLTAAAAGLLLVLVLLAAFVPVGAAVVGFGQVGVESRVKRIAHPTGGVIAEILVRNGQHVRKGEVLLRLDDAVSGADADYSRLTVEQLLAQRARLDAERLGADRVTFPQDLLAARTASAERAMSDERQLFAIRRAEERQMQAQLGGRISQYDQSIRGIEAQIASLRHQRALIGPELESVRGLWNKRLVTISRLNQLERSAADLDGNIGSLQAQIAQARARIYETQEQALQVKDTRRATAGQDLARINAELNDKQLRSFAASDQQSRTEIRAPYAGTVEKIAFAAMGEVIRPAEPIMEIVPDSDAMVVEAAISPVDIDQVQVGQKARIRFSAFNRAATPEIEGRVIYVASDRSETAQDRQSYFVARLSLDEAALRREGLRLRSGMPAETFIETGNRSLLSYATKPLRDQMARAFRDGQQ